MDRGHKTPQIAKTGGGLLQIGAWRQFRGQAGGQLESLASLSETLLPASAALIPAWAAPFPSPCPWPPPCPPDADHAADPANTNAAHNKQLIDLIAHSSIPCRIG